MYPTHVLHWLHKGLWKEIGWHASTPASLEDLRKHATALAEAHGDTYRIAVLSPTVSGDPITVIEHFGERNSWDGGAGSDVPDRQDSPTHSGRQPEGIRR